MTETPITIHLRDRDILCMAEPMKHHGMLVFDFKKGMANLHLKDADALHRFFLETCGTDAAAILVAGIFLVEDQAQAFTPEDQAWIDEIQKAADKLDVMPDLPLNGEA